PPGMRPQVYLRLIPRVSQVPAGLPGPATAVLQLLVDRGSLTSTQVQAALGKIDLRRAQQFLKRRGYIEVERLLRLPRVMPKKAAMVRLAAPRGQWEEGLSGLKRTEVYHEVLSFLEQETEPVEVSVVLAETEATAYHIKKLADRNLVSTSRQEIVRDPLEEMIFTPDQPPQLTAGQLAVWQEMATLLSPGARPDAGPNEALTPTLGPGTARYPVLLLGVTGAGKTELYMRAAADMIRRGQQALILVPEISLTPQTVHRFAVRFPGQVGLWHSGMSEGERYDTWRRVRSGELAVLVGARSALFAPFPALGLIIMDEEEDPSYKSGTSPYYHTREVAEQLARLCDGLLIMGSATPSLEAYARAKSGRYRLLQLPARIMSHARRIAGWQEVLHLPRSRYRPLAESDQTQRGAARAVSESATAEGVTIPLPPVEVVDMRAELRAGNRSIFSTSLEAAVDQALSQDEQVILFLNRRGTATYVFCRDCGWVATCPRCDVPLTQHVEASALICHRCNFQKAIIQQCPICRSRRVRAFGLGTEGLAAQAAERWPGARLLRWDRDVASSRGAHATIMRHFAQGDADILVGTQMIARGLDIPRVTVVGIISADTALHLPDFRAAERTFQTLAQVAGRAGRGILGGQVILQTYHPEHYAVQLAAAHDYKAFAERELAFRRRASYPPATRLARLVTAHRDPDKAQRAAEQMAQRLRAVLTQKGLPATDLIGPAPAFFARVRGLYRWQILLRSMAPADFLRPITLPPDWIVDIDPTNIL
ncbi:MAG: primosomal protein N', partial [Anaerolineae bacterium]|nr:primosomal protein N' [Anaerolineae bacterium]